MEGRYSAVQLVLVTLTILFLALGLYWIAVTPRQPQPEPRIHLEPPTEQPEEPGKKLLAAREPKKAAKQALPEPKTPVVRLQADPQPARPKKAVKPPVPVSKLEQEARAAVAAGKLERAEKLYKKLVRRDGKQHLPALSAVRHARLVKKGDEALARGRLAEARRAYRRALEEKPSIETERKLFRVASRLKAQEVAARHREELQRLVALAEQAVAQKKLVEAVRLYEQALALSGDPGPLKVRLQKARLALLKKLESRDQVRWLERARALFAKKRWEQADRAYRKAASMGELPVADRERVARIRREQAIADMVLIPAGKSWIGSSAAADEQPVRQVQVAAFYLDRYEVTNAQYDRFVRATGHRPPITWPDGQPPVDRGRHPVLGVSLDDALAYARWAGKRLPTELEWERAARGDDRRLYPWGATWSAGRANTLEEGLNGPVAVGQYRGGTSPFGVHDLQGNAQEWTASPYRPYGGAAATKETRYVLRGGSWFFPGRKLRVSTRFPDQRTSRLASYGFRCALDARPGRK